LLFEPSGAGADGPRIEIQVGSEFFEGVPDGCSPREAAALVDLTSDDEHLDPAPTLRVAGIQVDGQVIEFTIVSRADWWVGQGWWQGLAIEIRAEQVGAWPDRRDRLAGSGASCRTFRHACPQRARMAKTRYRVRRRGERLRSCSIDDLPERV
jgi:hypothetical protein